MENKNEGTTPKLTWKDKAMNNVPKSVLGAIGTIIILTIMGVDITGFINTALDYTLEHIKPDPVKDEYLVRTATLESRVDSLQTVIDNIIIVKGK